MKYQKLLSLLVLLMTAATGAWAQGYNVTFGGLAESEMNTTVNVTSLPYTFTAIGHDAFYPWTVISTAGNIFYNATVTSGGEGKVSANITYSDEMTITITGPFEGTATIHVTGEDDENRSISTDITVTCVAVGGNSGGSGDQTYSVTMKDGVKDADKWTVKVGEGEYQALPLEGVAAGTALSVKYSGMKKVKSVKAVKKAAAPVPVTYTALSGGEVLHVGDIIEIPDGQEWRINNSYIMSSRNPLTVVRANITIDQWDELTVTEAADGAYYVIKDTGGWYYCTYEGFTLPVTGTSDGIYVTYNGILWDEYPDYTFSVHEP